MCYVGYGSKAFKVILLLLLHVVPVIIIIDLKMRYRANSIQSQKREQ